MKNILNFLSENKHAISFLLIFSEVVLMIYGYIIDFHFGNIVLYVFCSSFIFYILASPFLIAKTSCLHQWSLPYTIIALIPFLLKA